MKEKLQEYALVAEIASAIAIVISLIMLPSLASAHHSFFTFFDLSITEELEGEVTQVQWQNPHVHFTVKVLNETGSEELWDIETTSVSDLRRKNISGVLLTAGDRIRIAGNPATRNRNGMWATHLLLPDLGEIVLNEKAEPRWSNTVLGKTGPGFATEGDGSAPQLGIFRVWSYTVSTPELFPADLDSYPLTNDARRTLAEFNTLADSLTANCAPKGLPTIMEQPYPIEFLEQDGNIILRMEQYDTVRVVHMEYDETSEQRVGSLLGYSTGSWEGAMLSVETQGINWGHFNQSGIPLSDTAIIVEQFTPTEDGGRLNYQMTVTDPSTFTEPVEMESFWLYVPNVTVEPFECVEG